LTDEWNQSPSKHQLAQQKPKTNSNKKFEKKDEQDDIYSIHQMFRNFSITSGTTNPKIVIN
jgi:hypothetical protein